MSTYECGSNTRKWWVYQATPGHWAASAPLTADGPNLPTQTFPTFREAIDHFVVSQRQIAAARFAHALAGGSR